MTEHDMERKFFLLRNWLRDVQDADKDADREDEHDSHNIGLADLHAIKYVYFNVLKERNALREQLKLANENVKTVTEERDVYVRKLQALEAQCADLHVKCAELTANQDEAKRNCCRGQQ
jgi:septal ring factor EnvC (AmiA/AmiB activator)